MSKEQEKLEEGLEENSKEINDVLKGCERHVPEKGKRYFDGNSAWETCGERGEIYEVRSTQKETNNWTYLVREKMFY